MASNSAREVCQEEILARLKRIEGQVRGVARMVEEKRSCGDIVMQLAAIKAAISQVGASVLSAHLATCLEVEVEEDKVKKALAEFTPLLKKWS
ncbi:MAG: CsoR family transcriptional regulator, copper-sensing transcriptional repressor [Clostridia bacterium]|nr:CsoR family transcriptional regulator, copper-sensing transcriptional repressor [Clostridia bacterium]